MWFGAGVWSGAYKLQQIKMGGCIISDDDAGVSGGLLAMDSLYKGPAASKVRWCRWIEPKLPKKTSGSGWKWALETNPQDGSTFCNFPVWSQINQRTSKHCVPDKKARTKHQASSFTARVLYSIVSFPDSCCRADISPKPTDNAGNPSTAPNLMMILPIEPSPKKTCRIKR